MHPCDHTGTAFIKICLIKGSADQFISDQRRLPDHLIGKKSGCIQCIYDLMGMLCYLCKALLSIKILGTGAKPKYIILFL